MSQPLSDKEREAQKIIVNEVIKAIHLLNHHFRKYCDTNKVKDVPMAYIDYSSRVFMENYAKGAENAGKE